MPRGKKSTSLASKHATADYRYGNEKRTNIPPAHMAGEGRVPNVPKAQYAYGPHLPQSNGVKYPVDASRGRADPPAGLAFCDRYWPALMAVSVLGTTVMDALALVPEVG